MDPGDIIESDNSESEIDFDNEKLGATTSSSTAPPTSVSDATSCGYGIYDLKNTTAQSISFADQPLVKNFFVHLSGKPDDVRPVRIGGVKEDLVKTLEKLSKIFMIPEEKVRLVYPVKKMMVQNLILEL